MGNQSNNLFRQEPDNGGSHSGKYGGNAVEVNGSALDSNLAARLLPTRQSQQQVSVPRNAATVLTKLSSFLAAQGRIADNRDLGTSRSPKISGIMGSGFFKMNPTLVQVEVIDIRKNNCKLLVSGAAKEGLIKQHSAEKAVDRVVNFLRTIG